MSNMNKSEKVPGYTYKTSSYKFDYKKEPGLDIPTGTPMHQVIAYHNGKAVGSVNGSHEADTLHIGDAGLDDEHMNRGVGKAMYEALYAHAAKHGVKKISTSLATEEANRVHQSLARKHNLAFNPEKFHNTYSNPFNKSMASLMTKGSARKLAKDKNDLVHYSRTPNLKQLDPNKMGTSGVGGAQYKRGIPENRSTFFYTADSKPEDMVAQNASSKYIVRPKPEHRIYDLGKDPENLMPEVRKRNQGAWNEDMLHGIIKEKGYHGVKWKMHDETHVVQMYHPMDIHSEHALKSSEGLNKAKDQAKDAKSIYNDQMAEVLTKGFVRNAMIAGAIALAPQIADKPANPPKIQQAKEDFSTKMLRAVATVESSSGQDTDHEAVNIAGKKAKAYGKFGLMPDTIKETVHLDPAFQKHRNISKLNNEQVNAYMDKNPGLEDAIARSHVTRLTRHFGNDPAKIGMAWLNGITGTKKALAEQKPIQEHWHVKKILSAFKGQQSLKGNTVGGTSDKAK